MLTFLEALFLSLASCFWEAKACIFSTFSKALSALSSYSSSLVASEGDIDSIFLDESRVNPSLS
jgi:hypothetical protein